MDKTPYEKYVQEGFRVLLIRSLEYTLAEPIGLMYLASYIRQHTDCQVRILDLYASLRVRNIDTPHLVEKCAIEILDRDVRKFKPDLVAISSMLHLALILLS